MTPDEITRIPRSRIKSVGSVTSSTISLTKPLNGSAGEERSFRSFGSVPYCIGDGSLTKLTVFCCSLYSFSFLFDLCLDIYNGYSFYKKHPCKVKSSTQTQFTANDAVSKEPRAHNETNYRSNNNSIITPESDFFNIDTIYEPLDERNIELNYELYAAAVFLFALVPTYVQSIWSYYMYWIDEKKSSRDDALFRKKMKRHIFLHFILPFAPIVRNYNCVKHGYRFHFYKEDENFREKIQHWRAWVVERNELALLKIVDSCLECIPQLILSIYVIRLEMVQGCTTDQIQYVKLIVSWATLTCNFAFYPYDIRLSLENYEKDVADGLRFVMMISSNFIWHGFTIIVRAFAIALMLTVFPTETSVLLLVHIFIMYILIAVVWKTNYCPEKISFGRSLLRLCYEIICALVLTVTWVNRFTPQKSSVCSVKWVQMAIYYIIITAENAAFFWAWKNFRNSDSPNSFEFPALKIVVTDIDDILIYGCMVLHLTGLFTMVLYYKCCHPVPIKSTINFEMLQNERRPSSTDTSSIKVL